MIDHGLFWLGASIVGQVVGPVESHVVRRRPRQHRWGREALLRSGFVEGSEGWALTVDDCVVHAHIGPKGIDLQGPRAASSVPGLVPYGDGEGGADPSEHYACRVRSCDPIFDQIVLCEHPDADQALGWLTYPRRQAAMGAVAAGAWLSRRWRQRIPFGPVGGMERAIDAFVGACHAFYVPPDRAPHIALHPLTLDPCLEVRVHALERLIQRGELPESVAMRMAREVAEAPRLALVDAGGTRAVRLASRIMLCGRKRAEAAVRLARVIRRDPIAAEAIDGIVEDLLVDYLLEALATKELGLQAVRAFRGLYLPRLPQILYERFGPEAPPRVEALRWELVCRYRHAWSDTWSPEVLKRRAGR